MKIIGCYLGERDEKFNNYLQFAKLKPHINFYHTFDKKLQEEIIHYYTDGPLHEEPSFFVLSLNVRNNDYSVYRISVNNLETSNAFILNYF